MTRPRLILASGSPRRRELLQGLGLRFDVVPSAVEESPGWAEPIGAPAEAAVSVALAKAQDVGARFPDAVVVGADTIVVLDGRTLGKPCDAAMAREMLSELVGRDHLVVTGVAVGMPEAGRWATGHEVTRVWMREAAPGEIDAYVKTGEPMDKAGAYAIQGKGSVLVERIEGCYFNVVGLPLARLARMLQEFGLYILAEDNGGDRPGTRPLSPDDKGSAA